jgi:hypothetical protein
VVVFFQGVDSGMVLSKRGAQQEALVIFDEVGAATAWCCDRYGCVLAKFGEGKVFYSA